ncbi:MULTISPECIES: hypothetical protein [Streptomyces]|nr:hypothetical protein [Streptomyces californicus]
MNTNDAPSSARWVAFPVATVSFESNGPAQPRPSRPAAVAAAVLEWCVAG